MGPDAPPRRPVPRPAIWSVYLALGAALTCLYVFVPPFAGSGPVMNVLGLSPVIAILVGLRIYRPPSPGPWIWFAIGFGLFFLGDVYTYSYPRLLGKEVPFPSLGDGFYVAVYPALMAGLFMLVRRRNPRSDRAGVIDSLIITLGLSLLSWVFLIAPYLHDTELTPIAKVFSIAYPFGDILLLAAAIRLAVDTGKRQTSFYLLASSVVALLVTDSAYGLALLNGTYDNDVLLDVGWISFYLLWGAAALHPTMRELDHAAPEKDVAPGPLPPGAADRRVADRTRRAARAGDPPRRHRRRRHRRRVRRPVPARRRAHRRAGAPAGALGGARTRAQHRRRRARRRDAPRGDLPGGPGRHRVARRTPARPRCCASSTATS